MDVMDLRQEKVDGEVLLVVDEVVGIAMVVVVDAASEIDTVLEMVGEDAGNEAEGTTVVEEDTMTTEEAEATIEVTEVVVTTTDVVEEADEIAGDASCFEVRE